jgi:hypothetical protein
LRIASQAKFTYQVEQAGGFSHAVFHNKVGLGSNGVLHVYLEGDGIPWILHRFVATDPTPREPLMLRLMSLDQQASVYVGRPCYNGFYDEQACHPRLWTIDRHSNQVIESMTRVIENLAISLKAKELQLYGHSGGGAMAMLIAQRLDNVRAVVTLAGNLDIKAWTSLHGYIPLYGSINPATQPALTSHVKQLHLMGNKDKKIPPSIVLDWVQNQENTEYFVFDDFNHRCCWPDIWPQTLQYLQNFEVKAILDQRFSGEGTLVQVYN